MKIASDQLDGELGAAIADATVWLDSNFNRLREESEPTSQTDEFGEFSFSNLPTDQPFQVRLQPPPGFFQSSPSEYVSFARDAISGLHRLVAIDTDTGTVSSLSDPISEGRHGLIKTRDGSYYGAGHVTDSLFRIDPITGQETLIGDTGLGLVAGLAYDPVGDEIYTLAGLEQGLGEPLRLYRVDRDTAELTRVSDHEPELSGIRYTTSMAFDWVRRTIVLFDNYDDTLYAYRLDGSVRKLGQFSVPTHFYNLVFDGQRYLTHAQVGDASHLFEVDIGNAQLIPLRSLEQRVYVNAADWSSAYEAHNVVLSSADEVFSSADFEVRYLQLSSPTISTGDDGVVIELPADGVHISAESLQRFCIAGQSDILLTESASPANRFALQLGDQQDRLTAAAVPAISVDMGTGLDTLKLTSVESIDLRELRHLRGVDRVDISASQTVNVRIDADSVAMLSDDAHLELTVSRGTPVQLDDATEWSLATPSVRNGQRMHRFSAASFDQALVEFDNGSGWTNPLDPLDINRDGVTTPLDALLIVNLLNQNLSAALDTRVDEYLEAEYVDPNGDLYLSPLDALLVINHLNTENPRG